MDMAVGDTPTPIRITAMATIPVMPTGTDLIAEATGGALAALALARVETRSQAPRPRRKQVKFRSHRSTLIELPPSSSGLASVDFHLWNPLPEEGAGIDGEETEGLIQS